MAAANSPKKRQGEKELFGFRRRSPCALAICCLIVSCALVFLQQPVWAMDVTLAWDANAETNLAGYKIYYGKITGGPYDDSASADGASPIDVPLGSLQNPLSPEFTVHGLPRGTYCFVSTAYDAEGLESLYSNEACTSPPSSPPNLAPILFLLLDD